MNVYEEWLQQYFDEVTPREFYRVIFPKGELDKKDAFTAGKYTGIIVAVTKKKDSNGRPKVKRYTITDDLDAVDFVTNTDDFCLCSPISYAGKARTAAAARYLYGIAVDVDHLKTTAERQAAGLIDLWNGHIMRAERIPKPTFIVSSGSGIHLYYVLRRPVPMYERIAKQLQRLKHELTALIWNEGIVDIEDDRDVQQEGIYQGFRMPWTITKDGSRARAFETGEKVTLEYLNEFVTRQNRVTEFEYKSDLSLKEAAAKYPDWYRERIEEERPRKYWNVSRRLYDWWKGEILHKARVGHRYYCLMTLAIYAAKCSRYDPKHNPNPVTYEELEADCFEIMERFESLTDDEKNHFTAADVQDALEAFQDRWNMYPRDTIAYRSGIDIKHNKRNGRKQADHVHMMNLIRDEINHNTTWNRIGNGRHSKRDLVEQWQREHPDGRKCDAIRDLHIDRKTVSKYWKNE